MFRYLRRLYTYSVCQAKQYPVGFMVVIALIILMTLGCNTAPSKQRYENSEFGISLEKPRNWNVKYDERSRSIVLKAEKGIWHKDSALTAIKGVAISPLPCVSEQELEMNIDRIGTLYSLETITLIQEPTVIESGEYEVGIATVSIPTMSILEDSTANQINVQAPDIFQTIELRTIKCPDNFAMVYTYKGNSKELNTEAETIVDSIKLTCSAEP